MNDIIWLDGTSFNLEDEFSAINLYGNKGFNLLKLNTLGLSIPPGFLLLEQDLSQDREALFNQIKEYINELERKSGLKFGVADGEKPLLISIRSSPNRSLPGILDTILNVGLNKQILESLNADKNYLVYLDNYRRFIKGFAVSVYGVNASYFEMLEQDLIEDLGFESSTQFEEDHLWFIIQQFKSLLLQEKGMVIPEKPIDQVMLAIDAITQGFSSYLKDQNFSLSLIIQKMVFGNLNTKSLVGVMSSHNPINGEKQIWGEYLINAQGKDLVSGVQTGKKLKNNIFEDEIVNKFYFDQIQNALNCIERNYLDIQEIEFTFEDNHLYILQSRRATLAIPAKLRIVSQMISENLISREEAQQKLSIEEVSSYLIGLQLENKKDKALARGLSASSGIACGVIALDRDDINRFNQQKIPYIFVRKQSITSDLDLMKTSEGILTATGGITSHAAVIARSLKKPCVVGCQLLSIDYEKKQIKVSDVYLNSGDLITIDGNTGLIFRGQECINVEELDLKTKKLYHWLDSDYN